MDFIKLNCDIHKVTYIKPAKIFIFPEPEADEVNDSPRAKVKTSKHYINITKE